MPSAGEVGQGVVEVEKIRGPRGDQRAVSGEWICQGAAASVLQTDSTAWSLRPPRETTSCGEISRPILRSRHSEGEGTGGAIVNQRASGSREAVFWNHWTSH